MRFAVLGNSGSGKSSLAIWLARQIDLAILDLDTVAWEPNQIAVPRHEDIARADVHSFCDSHGRWVVEGCYPSLIAVALEYQPLLVFLNPGKARCVENCRSRPWEPHKYPSREEQDRLLGPLLTWVEDYYSRDGEMSLRGHRRCFDAYTGRKFEVTTQLSFNPPSIEVLEWLR
ncbi:MAG: hypothetical protein MUF80_11160 [Burkholderiales bacterium]|jgi:adenylate kinase family enzyme|nr:hypothetical protein [Burkholderiales bacterium]